MVLFYLVLNSFCLYVLLFPLIFIHELGHAFIAKALGFRVFSVTLGYGKRILEIEPFGIKIRFNLYPFNGLTMALPQDNRAPRLKFWLYIFGGPFTHIIFISICAFFVVPRNFFVNTLGGFSFLEVFLLANIWLLFNSLYPTKTLGYGPGVYTDGHQLLHLPFMDKSLFGQLLGSIPRMEAWELLNTGRYEEAVAKYEELLAAKPDDIGLKHDLAVTRLNYGNYEEALDLFTELHASDEIENESFRVMLKNNIAWIIAVLKRSERYIDADRHSETALKTLPRFAAFIGTRGAVMIRTNRIEEGLDNLKTAFNRHSDNGSRAASACFMAIGEANRQNFGRAEKWLQTARQEFPGYNLIEMAEREVDEIKTPGTV